MSLKKQLVVLTLSILSLLNTYSFSLSTIWAHASVFEVMGVLTGALIFWTITIYGVSAIAKRGWRKKSRSNN
ncbi:MAG: hypothetical protein JRC90_10115 [Deltaproteobacteria bacterium]|nr:hypothetical protein [Deltaproteobacteria bacterium]